MKRMLLWLLSAGEDRNDMGSPPGQFDLFGADGKSVLRHAILPGLAVGAVASLRHWLGLLDGSDNLYAAVLVVAIPAAVRGLQRFYTDSR